MASPLRRSERIAKQPISTVRASKKGDMLVMRKLGECVASEPPAVNDQDLAVVFTGPLNSDYFSAMRDILPGARALSDAELMAAVRQATSANRVV
jgi:hypothetical protein